MQFGSLTKALNGLFDKSLNELPEALRDFIRYVVLPKFKGISSWDDLSLDERHSVAVFWDSLEEPATKRAMNRDKKYWKGFFQDMEKIRGDIAKWESVTTLTASDLEKKETRLAELGHQLASMELKQQNARVYYPFQGGDLKPQSFTVSGKPDYIPYPQAFNLLSARLNATPAEIAAWVHMWPDDVDGLAAYIDVNELTPPTEFTFDQCKGDGDYIFHLMTCWFLTNDVTNFEPEERFVTGQQLIEHWGKKNGIQVKAFIRAKIAEKRLIDYQPIMDERQKCSKENSSSIEPALFRWSHVEAVDKEDFGIDQLDISKLNCHQYPPNVLSHVIDTEKSEIENKISILKYYAQMHSKTSSEQEDINKKKLIQLEKDLNYLLNMKNPEGPDTEETESSDFGNDENNFQTDIKPVEHLNLDQKTQQSANEIDKDSSIGKDQGVPENPFDVFRALKKLTADEVSITFVQVKNASGIGANNLLEISARGKTKRVALAAFDLENMQSGGLNAQGAILLDMAQRRYPKHSNPTAVKMTLLRRALRKCLGIQDDPFEKYRRGTGWEPRFKIEDKRGAADERAKREAERRTDSYEQMNERGDTAGDTNQAYQSSGAEYPFGGTDDECADDETAEYLRDNFS